jgi:hypothetical protein
MALGGGITNRSRLIVKVDSWSQARFRDLSAARCPGLPEWVNGGAGGVRGTRYFARLAGPERIPGPPNVGIAG